MLDTFKHLLMAIMLKMMPEFQAGVYYYYVTGKVD